MTPNDLAAAFAPHLPGLKLAKSLLTLKQDRTTFRLKVSSFPKGRLETWERVGTWLKVEVEILVPAAAALLGCPASTVMMNGILSPTAALASKNHPGLWWISDAAASGTALAAAVAARAGMIAPIAEAAEHEMGFEAVVWPFAANRARDVKLGIDWPHPTQSIETKAITLWPSRGDALGPLVLYAAALLLRHEHACAARVLAAVQGAPADLQPQIDALQKEVASQAAAGAAPRAMSPFAFQPPPDTSEDEVPLEP